MATLQQCHKFCVAQVVILLGHTTLPVVSTCLHCFFFVYIVKKLPCMLSDLTTMYLVNLAADRFVLTRNGAKDEIL